MQQTGATGSGTQVGSGGALAGVRVLEIGAEPGEYCGLLLAGLGAEVVRVEPPGGSPTRRIGPFLDDVEDPERSLYFWHYNRGKRSVAVDLEDPDGRVAFRRLVTGSDIVVDSTSHGYLAENEVALEEFRQGDRTLITARITPFGDDGPWAHWKGSDLIHLALGGPAMNCGYDPRPDGIYDLPPMAGQMWHAYHITGEQVAMMVIAALIHRHNTGKGQALSCAVHEAVAKSTELDLMSWVMRAAPLRRQTCRHAAEKVSPVPSIVRTKDGRWFLSHPINSRTADAAIAFLDQFGFAEPLRSELEEIRCSGGGGLSKESTGRPIPGSTEQPEFVVRVQEAIQRVFGKFTYEEAPWRAAQELGLLVAPVRHPEENVDDPHWRKRGTFSEVQHPELGRAFLDVTSKWISDEAPWQSGRRAPLLNEDAELLRPTTPAWPRAESGDNAVEPDVATRPNGPLHGVRIFDFSWFLASAGGTRFLAALGAEVIKVEWHEHPDTRWGAMSPVGGRDARRSAQGPLPGVDDSDMGGQFNNKNPGKLGISLNVRHPEGLAIARDLISMSDVVAEGFSPGVLDRWGLGYDELKRLRPDIIYAQQSGMGAYGTYGRFRSVGPVAAAFAGTSDMSGLAEPYMPAGWGYSYLDWIGAYSFALAILSALHHRNETGRGQRIDASQCEAGLFVGGTAYLDWSANGRSWSRHGNRSPYKKAAPHGIYPCSGPDRWVAIACFSDEEWETLAKVAERPTWLADDRFVTLEARLANQDTLDAELSQWTRLHDPYVVMERLQEAGVPAGTCQTAEDRVESDPQLAHLGWLTEVTGSKIGTWPIAEIPVKFSHTPVTVAGPTNRGAPCYGEDNDYVYGTLLGRSADEINRLRESGVI